MKERSILNFFSMLPGQPRSRWWLLLLLLAAWLSLPLLLAGWNFGLHIAISVALYVTLALGLNLVNGQAGQLNLGYAAFFGIGAYTSAILMMHGWSFWATLLPAVVVTALVGALIGLPSLRVSGDYLGIVTLGFGEVTRLVLINWESLTGGPLGIPGIPVPTLFGYEFDGKLPYFYVITAFALLTWFVMQRLAVSKFGLQSLALREDAQVAQALGVDTGQIKMISFIVAAAVAGLAGAFYASYIAFVSPDTFVFNDSVILLCMVVLGGIGSIPGSVLGAVILTIAPQALQFLQDWRMILFGGLLTAMMVYKPSGLWGLQHRQRNAIKTTAEAAYDGKG